MESLDATFRGECLAVEEFTSLPRDQIVIADWHRDYNDYRPRSALAVLAPTEFTGRQPQPTQSGDLDQQPGASQRNRKPRAQPVQ